MSVSEDKDVLKFKPYFESERLIIRPFKQTQAKLLAEILNDYELVKPTTIPFPYREEYAVEYIATAQKNILKNSAYDLAVIEKESGELVGSIGLTVRDEISKRAEIGYWIRRDKQGKGYCAECAKKIIKFGFESLKLHKITARCLTWNTASENVMKKCGFVYEGRANSQILHRGVYEDVFFYGLLRKDYENQNQ